MYELTWTPLLYQAEEGYPSTSYDGPTEVVAKSDDLADLFVAWGAHVKSKRGFGPMLEAAAYPTIGKLRSEGVLYALHLIGVGSVQIVEVAA